MREPLRAYLDAQGLGSGDVVPERIGEGHSNITFLIDRDGERFVLRRPPRPPIPPSAHDVLREARLLTGVQDADVRTPPVLAVCDDESVIGAPFYVMEYIEGVVVTTQMPPELDSPEERRRAGDELVDALAEIHAVDWRACGLEGYGKPTGYLERQLRRFTGLWEHNKTRELPVIQELHGLARGEHARVARVDDRPRRLPPRQRDARERRACAADRDLRLGAIDDRRPARRPRLHDRHVGRVRTIPPTPRSRA